MKKIKTLSILCVSLGVLATGTVSALAYGGSKPADLPETEVAQPTQQVSTIQLSNADAVPLSFTNISFECPQWSDENDQIANFFAEYEDLTLSQAVEQFYTMLKSKADERLSAAIADGTITEEQSKEIFSQQPESLTDKLLENELFKKYKDTNLNELNERFPEIQQEIEALELDDGKDTIGEKMAILSELTLGEALDKMTADVDEKLASALADGTITQEQADRIREQDGDKSFVDSEIFKEYRDTKLCELLTILPQIMKDNIGAADMKSNGVNVADMLKQYGDLTLGEAMEKINSDLADTQSPLKERLDTAVADGKITREHADEVLTNQSQHSILNNGGLGQYLDQYKDVKVSELQNILPEIIKNYMQ